MPYSLPGLIGKAHKQKPPRGKTLALSFANEAKGEKKFFFITEINKTSLHYRQSV
jgi:hypothetical protein